MNVKSIIQSQSYSHLRNVSLDELMSHFILHPNKPRRVLWDFISFILLSYDMISIPLLICFDPDNTTFLISMAWMSLLFFFLLVGVQAVMVLAGAFHQNQLVEEGEDAIIDDSAARGFGHCWILLPACALYTRCCLLG